VRSRASPGLAAALTVAAAIVLSAVGAPAAAAGKAVDGIVNLNTAPPELLALLPGIGPAKVGSILAYRKRRPFRTVDELVRIRGIGRKQVRALRPHLAVTGPTTATPRPVQKVSPAAALAALSKAAAAPPAPAPPPRPPPPKPRPPPAPVRAGTRPTPGRDTAAAFPLAARRHCLRPP
jgi:competence protein ComEA